LSATPILSIRDIVKVFRNGSEVRAIDDVSFDVNLNEFICIITDTNAINPLILTPHCCLIPFREGGRVNFSKGGEINVLWVIRCHSYFGSRRGRGDDFLRRSTRCEVTLHYHLPSVLGGLFGGPRGQKK